MFFQYNPNFVFPSYDLKNYLDVLEIIVRRAYWDFHNNCPFYRNSIELLQKFYRIGRNSIEFLQNGKEFYRNSIEWEGILQKFYRIFPILQKFYRISIEFSVDSVGGFARPLLSNCEPFCHAVSICRQEAYNFISKKFYG